MVQKKSGNPINGTLLAAFLILIAAFLSSVVQQPQEISGQITKVTGFATAATFTSICQDAGTILKVSGYKDASAGTVDSTSYNIRICGDSTLGSGQSCKSDYSNAIIRIYDPNGDGKADTATVEKLNYVSSGTPTTSYTNSGEITSCTVDRNAQGYSTQCTPPAGSSGTKLLGIYEESNGYGQWLNKYGIYVSNNIKGEVVKCSSTSSCTLPSCTIGTLQATITEIAQDNSYTAKFGICADTKIRVASCSQSVKGRTCTTTAPETGLTKFTNYITDIINHPNGVRTFNYYDIYVESSSTGPTGAVVTGAFSLPPISIPSTSPQLPSYCSDATWSGDESDLNCGGSCNKCADTLSCWSNSDCSSNNCYFNSATTSLRSLNGITSNYRSINIQDIKYQGVCQAAVAPVQPPTGSSGYTNLCFGNGPYHYEDNAKGNCAVGNCIFTISADTNAKIADCSSTNAYSKTVCTGGACFGSDCSQIACQDQVSCNSNPTCSWDSFEKATIKCKGKGFAICNKYGIKICNPADFIAGDYSCLYKDPQTSYYTKACVGSGQVGFWHIPEVY